MASSSDHERYRAWLPDRIRLEPAAGSAEEIPLRATMARLARTGKSHRGIWARKKLVALAAVATDQAFLEELSTLDGLVHLELEWPTTATDLAPVAGLENLRVLKIDSPRNIRDFTPILSLPQLETLFIENARHMTDLDWLRPLKDRLKVLGIEGSMWTKQRLPGLSPLEGFAAEAMFFTSVRLEDRDLSPLTTCPNLRLLHCARFAPREAFRALAAARPDIDCQWFDDAAWPR